MSIETVIFEEMISLHKANLTTQSEAISRLTSKASP